MGNNKELSGGDVLGELFNHLGIVVSLNKTTRELEFTDRTGKYAFVWIAPEVPNREFSCTKFDRISMDYKNPDGLSEIDILESLLGFIQAKDCRTIMGEKKRKHRVKTIFTIPQFTSKYELKIKLSMLKGED
jgi:hypothetical protein